MEERVTITDDMVDELLSCTIELLSTPDTWTQGTYWTLKSDAPPTVRDEKKDFQFCLVGALHACSNEKAFGEYRARAGSESHTQEEWDLYYGLNEWAEARVYRTLKAEGILDDPDDHDHEFHIVAFNDEDGRQVSDVIDVLRKTLEKKGTVDA